VKNELGKFTTEIGKKYQIVFVTSEVAPWSKTGGLGEAMDGLPVALAALGHRVMTIAPRYDQYAEAWDTAYSGEVPMGSSTAPVRAFHAYQAKVDRVFVDHDCFLAKVEGKSGSMLYGPEWGKDFADNQWRFIYFAKAVLKIIQELPLGGYPYGGQTIVVVNDWHCALVPVYLSQMQKEFPEKWGNTKTALLIHNAVFQGRFDRDDPEEPQLEVYGLPESVMRTFTFNMPIKVGRTEPKVKRCINWMGSAAQYVDKILTVSPTYAWELINLPEMGCELDEIFLAKGVTGIVNGVKEIVSPMNATFCKKCEIPKTFTAKDVDEKKAELKAMLQKLYGLPVSAGTPLCIFVGRMDLQKGYDYLLAALPAILDKVDLQLIVIGTGRADLVASTRALVKKKPKNIYLAGWCGAERYAMVAGADYNLMPSRWEPCGLSQMESMRFGTLPVVSQTGGLVDTVQDFVTGIHMRGSVSVEKELDPSSVELMAQALERCVDVYADKDLISKMRKAAMTAGVELTWSNSALQYEAVFEELGVTNVLPKCSDSTVTLEHDKLVGA
jgi:granule-bound starch synthase